MAAGRLAELVREPAGRRQRLLVEVRHDRQWLRGGNLENLPQAQVGERLLRTRADHGRPLVVPIDPGAEPIELGLATGLSTQGDTSQRRLRLCERGLRDGDQLVAERRIVEGLGDLEDRLGPGRRDGDVGRLTADRRQGALGGDAAAGVEVLRDRQAESVDVLASERQVVEAPAAERVSDGPAVDRPLNLRHSIDQRCGRPQRERIAGRRRGVAGEQTAELGGDSPIVGGRRKDLRQQVGTRSAFLRAGARGAELSSGQLLAPAECEPDRVVESQHGGRLDRDDRGRLHRLIGSRGWCLLSVWRWWLGAGRGRRHEQHRGQQKRGHLLSPIAKKMSCLVTQ